MLIPRLAICFQQLQGFLLGTSWQRLQDKSSLILFRSMNLLIPHKLLSIQQQISLLSSQAQAWQSSSYYVINFRKLKQQQALSSGLLLVIPHKICLGGLINSPKLGDSFLKYLRHQWLLEGIRNFQESQDLSPKSTCHHPTPSSDKLHQALIRKKDNGDYNSRNTFESTSKC